MELLYKCKELNGEDNLCRVFWLSYTIICWQLPIATLQCIGWLKNLKQYDLVWVTVLFCRKNSGPFWMLLCNHISLLSEIADIFDLPPQVATVSQCVSSASQWPLWAAPSNSGQMGPALLFPPPPVPITKCWGCVVGMALVFQSRSGSHDLGTLLR